MALAWCHLINAWSSEGCKTPSILNCQALEILLGQIFQMYPKLLYLLLEISKVSVQILEYFGRNFVKSCVNLEHFDQHLQHFNWYLYYLLENHENYDGNLDYFVEISNISDDISNISVKISNILVEILYR